ncbi:M23 family metallopeptidase [Brevibacterium casei]|uniref:M23 family metallopeptidase n=1 Tax=Brevibacterium casei TaxID=33889 RepID=UPI00191A8FDA|nr:M23 family metallopeptidase [Brevibacterium casei]
MRKVITAILALVLLAPMLLVLGVGMIANPAAHQGAACESESLIVGPIPDELTSETVNGETVTLNRTQLERAASIITGGSSIEGVNQEAVIIALMAALTESTLRQLANTGTYPESGDYEHDGDGADHDSLGLFQMRPQSGWGTVAELMDIDYQAEAFFGGPTGPNYPSPRGLLDIPDWESMERGEVAQAVEVSAHPERYANWEPVALDIIDALIVTDTGGDGTPADPDIPETGRLVFPLPEGTYVWTSGFGWRSDPFTGVRTFHSGTDLAAPDGTPVLAIADGIVVDAGMVGGTSGQITIEHTIDGKKVATRYIHMWSHGIHVSGGDRVQAGDHIGDVGSSGYSTGPHLHLQIHPGGANGEPVDPEPWLAAHDLETGVPPEEPAPGGMCL